MTKCDPVFYTEQLKPMLDKYQPGWINGENITSETKELIKRHMCYKDKGDRILQADIKYLRKLLGVPTPSKAPKKRKKKTRIVLGEIPHKEYYGIYANVIKKKGFDVDKFCDLDQYLDSDLNISENWKNLMAQFPELRPTPDYYKEKARLDDEQEQPEIDYETFMMLVKEAVRVLIECGKGAEFDIYDEIKPSIEESLWDSTKLGFEQV